MKRFLMMAADQNSANTIVDDFVRCKSLYKTRSTFRGCMGVPRFRSIDRRPSTSSYNSHNLSQTQQLKPTAL